MTNRIRGRVVRWVLPVVLLAVASLASQTPAPAPTGERRPPQLVIVLDGLRPDYVTPEVMPNLYALGQRGIVFTNHHRVVPDRHTGERVVDLNRRLSRASRFARQHRLFSAGRSDTLSRYQRSIDADADQHCDAGRLADCADTRRDAADGRKTNARRQRRIHRIGVSPESQGIGRRHSAEGIHAARVARAGSGPAARSSCRKRRERRARPTGRRSVLQGGSRRSIRP